MAPRRRCAAAGTSASPPEPPPTSHAGPPARPYDLHRRTLISVKANPVYHHREVQLKGVAHTTVGAPPQAQRGQQNTVYPPAATLAPERYAGRRD